METAHSDMTILLKNAGVSKTIYALVMPETETAFSSVVDEDREKFLTLFREAWTQKQDKLHESFFAEWKHWTRGVVSAEWGSFPFYYPCSGASEALRDLISSYGNRARTMGFAPKIHLFAGEYEGFASYAKASGIEVLNHARSAWFSSFSQIGETDQIYLSNPSAIDGNVWNCYGDFMKELPRHCPSAEVIVDLTYVGCVARPYSIDLHFPNIASVVFSLSKPMGVYYHRIGGCFSKAELPGLFGNKWFKNITSLVLGEKMMRSHAVRELPLKYSPLQKRAIDVVRHRLGLELEPCDVFLLGFSPLPSNPTPLQEYLKRNDGTSGIVRACLTPTIASLIDPKLCTEVTPRKSEVVLL
jgi:hypothetical protein